jgi:neurotransmitter:Na+ symporter, NSS family
VLKSTILRDELAEMPPALFTAWRWLLRIVAPALVLIVLLRAVI